MRPRGARGFTLIELVVATSLSIFVLMAVVMVSTSMIRFQFEAVKKGEVTGATLYSLQKMHRELEDASRLVLPVVTGNVISGCTNWSEIMPAAEKRLDSNANSTGFYYCVAPAGCGAGIPCTLYRYNNSAATCSIPAPTCGSGASEVVVYQSFYLGDGASNFFGRDTRSGGVSLNYIVGNSTPTPSRPNPVAYKVATTIGFSAKGYNNATD